MNLSPSPSRGLIPLRLYNFLSQLLCHAPLALRSCPVHPAQLIRSDSRRVRRSGYSIMSNGMNGDCIDEDNSPLLFPSLESNAKRDILSA
ncbi:unnamed protein product [Penicillium salamii]|uniref:Uncharacterized protein n=1 Tax=Penicillium salamii TaxID=1612424 RepID=A0A9W4NMR1_9EURO|nr:unnamed protein product [Penicillium salamii]CAG8101756.1 unnamed protein product [Penicillium salamii]CAG8256112.1 unnamed protein product [Penicillium salamii]CAG8362690.1 unnamed protein product [Penicillium salamii]CAG8365001.1 unnamed protein product [Penicillium salamii]